MDAADASDGVGRGDGERDLDGTDAVAEVNAFGWIDLKALGEEEERKKT